MTFIEKWDANVSAGDNLGGELAHNLPQLHREESSTDLLHQLGCSGNHAFHLFGSLIGEHVGECCRDAVGNGFSQLSPQRHGLFNPLQP